MLIIESKESSATSWVLWRYEFTRKTLRVILNINTFIYGISFATYIPIQGYLGTLLVTIRLSKYR